VELYPYFLRLWYGAPLTDQQLKDLMRESFLLIEIVTRTYSVEIGRRKVARPGNGNVATREAS
jgi:hypothetical protein